MESVETGGPAARTTVRPRHRGRPIRRPRPLHEEVVDRLRDMIIEGELPTGMRLHEINLAQTLNVSRTPLREALKLLAQEGLVDLRPGRGARVAALSPEDVEQLFEVISGLERQAAELAAERITPRELKRIQDLHTRMAAHHMAGERHDYSRLNHEIHIALVAAAKNSTLSAIHATLLAKARRARYAALESRERWHEVLGEHEALMTALTANDSALAGRLIKKHVQRTGEVVSAILKQERGSPL